MKGIMSKLILESLDKNRLLVFEKLDAFKHLGVLGGGTALSLQIGHRVSYDFDIFTYEKLKPDFWKKIKNVFGNSSEKLLDTEDQINLLTPEGVFVTFFADDYKFLFEPVKTNSIGLLDPKDIATNKAFTLGRRPKWRDYTDLYFLFHGNYISIDKLIELSKRKFESDFSERLFLEQLVYWRDVDDFNIEFLHNTVKPKIIKDFLEEEVKKFKTRFLG